MQIRLDQNKGARETISEQSDADLSQVLYTNGAKNLLNISCAPSLAEMRATRDYVTIWKKK